MIARFIENETQDILRRIAEKQADLMGEFSVRPQTLDQVDHTPVGIFRRITILQEQSPGTVICQITLQRIGPVDIDKGEVYKRQGPTAMGMVQFMNEADSGAVADNNYHFNITAATDEVSAALAQGTTDIAAVPANLASVLYNNTEGGVQVLAINTLGVLYIVESGDTVHSVEDLRGKTIYASGKGNTPEAALSYVLTQNGIDPSTDVTIEWKSCLLYTSVQ